MRPNLVLYRSTRNLADAALLAWAPSRDLPVLARLALRLLLRRDRQVGLDGFHAFDLARRRDQHRPFTARIHRAFEVHHLLVGGDADLGLLEPGLAGDRGLDPAGDGLVAGGLAAARRDEQQHGDEEGGRALEQVHGFPPEDGLILPSAGTKPGRTIACPDKEAPD